MTRAATQRPIVRCAIYTRKSSEEGLDQAFNSLHAQREACEAYVKSQIAEGWRLLPTLYDDGGFSGGNLERPALQRLLADVAEGRIDTVVVYKIDRLTRALTDFAKIVEIFDAQGVSFVSVTQAFNTTTSMGRLTLNVLLSFAQFEREVTGERIRDKIAASKKKGMWMGGPLPLGYDAPVDLTTRALVINAEEAEQVRLIFQTYLKLRSVSALEVFLDGEGLRSKRWTSKAGRQMGGCKINRGALFHLLKSRLYLGEIPHRDQSYPGAHPPIIERDLFDQVQALLAQQRHERRTRPTGVSTAALRGLLFDADGAPMCPSFTHRRSGRVYRYYVSAPLQQGRSVPETPDAIRRVAASEIEVLIHDQLISRVRGPGDPTLLNLTRAVRRIDIEATSIRITLQRTALLRSALDELASHPSDDGLGTLVLPIRCKLRGGRTWITLPPGSTGAVRTRRDPVLIRALRQAHRLTAALGWRSTDGDLERLQTKVPDNPYQRQLCRLAFLAPDLQAAIIEGRQPPALNLERLIHEPIPLAWPEQRRLYGDL